MKRRNFFKRAAALTGAALVPATALPQTSQAFQLRTVTHHDFAFANPPAKPLRHIETDSWGTALPNGAPARDETAFVLIGPGAEHLPLSLWHRGIRVGTFVGQVLRIVMDDNVNVNLREDFSGKTIYELGSTCWSPGCVVALPVVTPPLTNWDEDSKEFVADVPLLRGMKRAGWVVNAVQRTETTWREGAEHHKISKEEPIDVG